MSVIKKFVASKSGDALRRVREVLGPDAVILSNRTTTAGGAEIMAVAARDMDMIVPSEGREKPARALDDYTVQLSPAASALRPAAAKARPPARENVPPPLASRPMPRIERSERSERSERPERSERADTVSAPRQAEIVPVEVMEEIRALRKMVEQHLA